MPGSRERGEEAMQVTAELFRQVPLFSGLADEDLESLLAVLSARLRKANQQIGNLALHDVYGRVARVLLEMASESGSRGEDGRVAFRRPTHQEIANMIGATRETVSRMISDLHRQGYIEIAGKNVIIHDALPRNLDVAMPVEV